MTGVAGLMAPPAPVTPWVRMNCCMNDAATVWLAVTFSSEKTKELVPGSSTGVTGVVLSVKARNLYLVLGVTVGVIITDWLLPCSITPLAEMVPPAVGVALVVKL